MPSALPIMSMFGKASFAISRYRCRPNRLQNLTAALLAAQQERQDGSTSIEPDRAYRGIEFWGDGRPATIRVEDERGTPKVAAPRFERLWKLLPTLFPGFEA